MSGPKPKPTALKLLQGNPGRRPLNPDEPTPAPVENFDAPAHLPEDATREWVRLAPLLARNGLLTELDLDALEGYCEAWCRWRDANAQIRKFGAVIKAKNGFPMQSPYIPIANKAMDQMRAFMDGFGMNPGARSRIKVTKTEAMTNPLDRFIKRVKA